MKKHSLNTLRLFVVSVFSGALAIAAPGIAAPEKPSQNETITVNVNDPTGHFAVSSFRGREALLKSAFREAADTINWQPDYRIVYNDVVPDEPKRYLSLRIIEWDRNKAGLFECVLACDYWDENSKEMELKQVHAIHPQVLNLESDELAEQFAEVAQDAFQEALYNLQRQRGAL